MIRERGAKFQHSRVGVGTSLNLTGDGHNRRAVNSVHVIGNTIAFCGNGVIMTPDRGASVIEWLRRPVMSIRV